MPESFGAELRQRREQQQIALTTIAEQTKIKLALLEALERDDVSRWPAGIFRRAFVRSYAHAIGLDPDVVVHDFMERYPDPFEVAAAASTTAPDGNGVPVSDGPPPTRFRYIASAALDSLSQRLGFLQRGKATVVEEVAATEPARLTTADDCGPVPPAEDDAPVVEDDAPVVRSSGRMAEPTQSEVPPMPDLVAAAQLCTELGRIDKPRDAGPLLQEAARILDAVGLIVWVWDPKTTELRPALTHGYPATVLAQLPRVRRDADNATAAAFRSAQTSVVNDSTLTSGALVVPMMTPAGCAGVLAIELPRGSAQRESVRAVVTIFAAQLARLIGVPRAAGAVDRKLA